MQEEVVRVIKELEKRGWITKNEHLTHEGLAMAFIDEFMKMPLKTYINFINR